MPRNLADRIRKKIKALAQSPYTNRQAKMLKGAKANRLRVGDWRILYTINDSDVEIWIIKIAPRGEAYK